MDKTYDVVRVQNLYFGPKMAAIVGTHFWIQVDNYFGWCCLCIPEARSIEHRTQN